MRIIDSDVSAITVVKYISISGTISLVAGIDSAINNIKTEKAKRTVIPNVIFSPESGGRQKPSSERIESQIHGSIILNK